MLNGVPIRMMLIASLLFIRKRFRADDVQVSTCSIMIFSSVVDG